MNVLSRLEAIARERPRTIVLPETAKAANDLSRGCSAEDIVDVIVITSVEASLSATPPAR